MIFEKNIRGFFAILKKEIVKKQIDFFETRYVGSVNFVLIVSPNDFLYLDFILAHYCNSGCPVFFNVKNMRKIRIYPKILQMVFLSLPVNNPP